jgi:hypothetical protein
MATPPPLRFGPVTRQGVCSRFPARGFAGAVAVTTYAQHLAACGMPLGGLGTGYVEIGTSGSW